MKNPKQEAQRWLKQSEYDLGEAKRSLEHKSYSYACFFAEQSAQKSLKALLISHGERFITIHSIAELIKEATKFNESLSALMEEGKKLDRYYLSSRYPDALPEPAIPFESYTSDEAQEAVAIAKKIFSTSETSSQT